MAPPTTRPCLQRLDRAAVGRDYAHAVYAHLAPRLAACGGEPPDATAFAATVATKMAALVRYAQTGEGDPTALTFEALRKTWFEGILPARLPAPPPSAVATVFLAAEARLRLAGREAVSARALGALADLSEAQVRNLLYRKVRFNRRGIPAKVARAFLAARAVPGFSPPRLAAAATAAAS